MNFFEHQDRAKKRTNRLALLFAMSVVAIIAAIYLVVALVASLAHYNRFVGISWWRPDLLLVVAGITLAVIALGSLWKTVRLRQGGRVVAQMLGGVPVAPNTPVLAERRLLNVVEEMAIASGTPVPEVYVLPNESAINAFAAGFTPSDAAIGVTRGCVEKLDRDELQGVIAHEFSHILHGDMRLNIRLIGLLNGILLIGLAGYFVLRTVGFAGRGSSRGRGGGGAIVAVLLVGLTMMVVGYVGVFFGRLIKSGVSRQREFLADASSVQFTRNPDGITGALKKIGGFAAGSQIEHRRAEEASHLFFGNSRKKRFLLRRLMATHPPLQDRIRAIEPQFDGEFPTVAPDYRAPETAVTGLAAAPPPGRPAPPPPEGAHIAPEQLVAQVGAPSREHVAHGAALIEALPEAIRDAAREPFGAQAVIYALLIDSDTTIMEAQFAALERAADPAIHRETIRLAPGVAVLERPLRLPLVDLALPALRQLSKGQFDAFRRNVQVLIEADRRLDLFEFTLQKILLRHLRTTYEGRPAVAQYHSLRGLREEARLLLATLAYAGHSELAAAQAAFAAAKAQLGGPGADLTMPPTQSCTLPAFDLALDRLDQASPAIKGRILSATATCVAHDGVITPAEAELLRAIANGLGCPMPPVIA